MLVYIVACEFADATVAQEWVDWLSREHIAAVCRAGALSAEVLRLDGDAIRYEVHYRFPDRRAFERYERDHAPLLRAEGLEAFPLELGLRYERRSGEVTVVHAPAPLPRVLP